MAITVKLQLDTDHLRDQLREIVREVVREEQAPSVTNTLEYAGDVAKNGAHGLANVFRLGDSVRRIFFR